MSPLARRLLIVAWGIPLFVVTAYLGGWYFHIIIALMGVFTVHELYALLNPGGARTVLWPVYAVAAIMPFWVNPTPHLKLPVLLVAALIAVGFIALTQEIKRGQKAIGAALVAPIYPLLPLLYFAWLRDLYGWQSVFFLLALLWIGDTAAYAGGRLTGRHLLAPQISPKKTVEGLIWALVFSLVVAWIAHRLWFDGLMTLSWTLAAGVVVWGFGAVGDLFESMLKRAAGVKDSSRLLSEHGGALDRFDSLLFAVVPLFYIFHLAT